MNQDQTAMADVFSRLSEQAAGTAGAARPSHAPFFAPLRDVDLPSPIAVLAGAHQAPSSFAPWVDDTVGAARTVWLDPLIPPGTNWADRPIPTPAWLASTLPPDTAATAQANTPVAVSTAPAAAELESPTEAGLMPPTVLGAGKPSEDATVLASTAMVAAEALPPSAAPAGLSDYGPSLQAGGTIAHVDAIDASAGAPAEAHAAAKAPASRDGSEFPAVVSAEEQRTVAAAAHASPAEPADAAVAPVLLSPAPAGDMPPARVQPGPRKESLGAEVSPVQPAGAIPAAQPGLHGEVDPLVLPVQAPSQPGLREEVAGAAAPTTLQPASLSAEGRLPAGDTVADAHGGETLPTARRTSGPTEAAPAGLELAARAVYLRPETDFAQLAEEPGSGSRQHGLQHRPRYAEGEPRLRLEGEQASANASVQPILPQRTAGAPDQQGAAGGTVPPQERQAADLLRYPTAARQTGQPTAAVQPVEATGGPTSTPGIPAPGEHVLPRTVETPQTPPQAPASTAIGAAGNQAPVAAATGMAVPSPDGTYTRALPAVQPSTRSAGRGEAMLNDAPSVAGAPVPDATGAKHQEQRVVAPSQPLGQVAPSQPAEPIWTPAGHEVVQRTGVTRPEPRNGSSTGADLPALAASPAVTPHPQASVRAAAGALHAAEATASRLAAPRHAESAQTAGTLPATQDTPAIMAEPPSSPSGESPAQVQAAVLRPAAAAPGQANAGPASAAVPAALTQPRNEALPAYSAIHPTAAVQPSISRPAVEPRLAQAVSAPSAAGRAGRQVEPQVLPTVHVTIGRVEVRFATPVVEQVPSARPPARQNLPLNAILQRDVWGAA